MGCLFPSPPVYNGEMVTCVKRRTLHVWLACLAILFAALAPSISHALAAAAGADRVEICTVDGTKTVVLQTATKKMPAKDGASHHMEHCAYCVSNAVDTALPPAPATVFAPHGGHGAFPALFYASPSPLFCWTAGTPRAPPAA